MTGTLPSRDRIAEPSPLDTPAGTYRGRDRPRLLANLVAIARPDHWFKNIFMLPGGALAVVLVHDPFPGAFGWLLLALVSTCLIASANYTISEWLDAEFDRHHPVKKSRPSAAGQITAPVVYALRKLGPKRRANYAKPVARLAVFANIVEHRESHQAPSEALGRASRPR